MFEAVILAAGLSSRMKQFKLALPLEGHTVLECTLLPLYPFCSKIWIVCGKQIAIVKHIVSPYDKIEIIGNELYEQGMFSSIKKGVSEVKEEYFFLLPGDYPLIKSSTYSKLIEFIKVRPEEKIVIPDYNGRKGHPVLLKRDMIEPIRHSPVTSTLREIIIHYGGGVTVPVDDSGILCDLDTDEDYEVIKQLKKGM